MKLGVANRGKALSAPVLPLTLGALVLLLVSIPLAVTLGTTDISPADTWSVIVSSLTGNPAYGVPQPIVTIIWEIRIPRVILACVVGAGLAVVGTVIQALVRNSLADPYILGISSGASVGAAAIIVFNAFAFRAIFGSAALSVAGFTGALVAMGVVYLIARSSEGISGLRLILGGIAAGFVFSAVTSLMMYLGTPNAAGGVVFWLLGSFGRAEWAALPIPIASLLICTTYFLLRSNWLNAVAIGDDTARSVGIRVERFRLVLFIMCSLLTGVLVAISGVIGFVGLLIPHFARLIVGADNRKVLMFSLPVGAVFVLWADIIARVVLPQQALPIGIVTALIGGPLFIAILIRRAT